MLSDRSWSELQVWLRAAALAKPPGPEATCWISWASQGLGRSEKLKYAGMDMAVYHGLGGYYVGLRGNMPEQSGSAA